MITPEVVYDPFSVAVQDDPYPFYERLRDEHPLYRNEERGFWVLSRHADVQAAARDWESFSSASGVELDDGGDTYPPGNLLACDPPRHDLLRKLVQPAFNAHAVAALEVHMRSTVRKLGGELLEQGEGDIAADFAWPLAIDTICALFGLWDVDRAWLHELLLSLETREPDSHQLPQRARDAARELYDTLAQVLGDRRRAPRDDLLTRIVTTPVGDGQLQDEAIGLCFILLIAGTDTTASLISNSLLLLAERAADRARMTASPEAAATAIEELLRYEAPVQGLARVTTRDVGLHGRTVRAGERVLLLYGSANRDYRHWIEPDRLLLTRPPRRNLGFGEGIHFCLGKHLARLEALVAFEELLPRLPDYEVNGPIVRLRTHTNRGLTSLPVRFTPRDWDLPTRAGSISK
jgi:hypothetical protein